MKSVDLKIFSGVGRIAVIAMMVGKMLMLVSICDSAFGNIGWDEGKAPLKWWMDVTQHFLTDFVLVNVC